ncbi:glyoxalase family protein [Lysinibacillus composti]|uniref:Ring-cleaving dioxygenase n=1 Tax=Lysinibacillus composti TaxID=720633 RepID=A0A3N9UK83_9BACI|nr:ring-cleaving dioxygenase [Lysinibacillus composti]MBM7610504.1 glyoxalase family protein [Lysinibacillus composti]RQW71606.1 ring-cleaving dioxygenase [Lysinibacillus composti]
MHKILGHHHISMITKNAKRNNQFYQNVLGLRRVKTSVNQDDPSMYHLFFGDVTGSPGTGLTFFEIPMAGSTHRGTNAITQIGLLVPNEESLVYWKKRFDLLNVKHQEITTYAGREALPFEDPEGLRLILVNNNGEQIPEEWALWEDSIVAREHRILGMGPIEITVKNLNKLASTLTEVFDYVEVERTDKWSRYQSIKEQTFGEIVIKQLDGPKERAGRGSIHHLAIRAKNEEELKFWEEKVKERGYQSSGIVDRYYFKSIYFRESNGILIEIATDDPGFTVDSSVESLGEKLDLPPFLEEKRAEIEAKLEPLDD